jgi:N-acyl-D-aspartate/D-glutamate deacylase
MPTLLAEALGMTTEDLYAAQTAGQTVAEIAAAQGVDLADVVTAVVAPHVERLTQAVADGRLTQEQVDAMLVTMAEQMTSRFETLTDYGAGCGRWGSGEFGPLDDTETFDERGHRGGMGGGRRSAPQAPDA